MYKKKLWIYILIAIASFLIGFFVFGPKVYAETCWVLCQPDSYVNIRETPKKTGIIAGLADCGMEFEATKHTKAGFQQVYNLSLETDTGWINKGYLVYSQPVEVNSKVNIYSNGRVACWRSIGGRRRCWVRSGDTVELYWVSEEWSVTNKGYIKTEFLGVDYETLLNIDRSNSSEELHFEE